jgi:hypothetical protein
VLPTHRWLALVAALCAGCSQATEADAGLDAGIPETFVEASPPDAGPSDRDRDGVCDATERVYHTNPDDPDTDRDGLLDGFELDAFTSPLAATDPGSDERITLRERAGERVETTFAMLYRGQGEAVTGLLLDRLPGLDGREPSEFGATIAALTAEPRANVGDLLGPVFLGVNGRTRLTWSLSFEWPAIAPLGCRRAYVALQAAFAEGHGRVYARQLVLDVVPEGVVALCPVRAGQCR